MRHSRYIWVIGLILVAFLGMMVWESPEVVWTALADPGYNDSARATVQHFWNLMDSRQLDLAHHLFSDNSAKALAEFRTWEKQLRGDPFLAVQRVDFIAADNPQRIVTKVYWNDHNPTTFLFALEQTKDGWRIIEMKPTDGLSLVGGNSYGEFLGTWPGSTAG